MEFNVDIQSAEITEGAALYIRIAGVKGRVAPRDHLIYELLKKAYAEGFDMANQPFLSVKMSCGGEAVYEKSSDVPWESVPCPCGNPAHWLILYVVED